MCFSRTSLFALRCGKKILYVLVYKIKKKEDIVM